MIRNESKKVISSKAKISKLIYTRKQISKPEIAKILGLSMPTVLQNIKELGASNIVEEVGSYESTGGRKAKMISLVSDNKNSIGVDITNKDITIVKINMRGILLNKKKYKCKYKDSIEYYKFLGECLDNFIESYKIDVDKIIGVGISIPGIIDEENLLLVRSHTLGISNVSLNNFKRFINFNTCFKNDANSAAYAELFLCEKQSVYLSLNNTVGGAIYMMNKIYMGENFKSAEFGHMIIEPSGEKCYCGKKGCVDAYCSTTILGKNFDGDLGLFFKGLKNKDNNCLELWSNYVKYLAITISNLRIIFDCEVVLGGYLAEFLDDYIIDVYKNISKYNDFDNDISYIKIGKYKREASAVGIAMQFIDDFLESLK